MRRFSARMDIRLLLLGLVVANLLAAFVGSRSVSADFCKGSAECGTGRGLAQCQCFGEYCDCFTWGSGCGAGVSCACASGCAQGGDCPPCAD